MQQFFTDYPWLVLLGAVLVGMLIMWLLEMFVLRRNIKSNLTDLQSTLKQRDAELQTAQTTLKESNAELKRKGDDVQSLTAARETAEKQTADLTAQFDQTTADLNAKLNQANADLTAAQQSRQQLETTLNARSKELSEERAKLAALTTKSNETVAQLQSLTGERDKLTHNLAATEKDLNEHKAQFRGALSEVAKLTATAAATAAIVKGLEASKGELTTNVETLNGELTTARGESERLSGLLAETTTAKETVETELAQTRTRVEDLEGIKTALEGQVSDLENKNGLLDADVAKLTAGAIAAAAVIKQLEGDKSALTEAHTALGAQFESLERAKALDDAELAELKLQLNKVNESLGITMRDKETYQETLATRVSELGQAQTQLMQAKEDNSNLLADVAKFTARAATAAALVQELEGSKRNLSEQLERTRGELDAERARGASLAVEQTAAPETSEPPASENGADKIHAVEMTTEPSSDGAGATLAPAMMAEAHHDDGVMPFASVCPQDLSAVHEIGPVFEQRLYNAGIGTYWDLSQKSEDELASILGLDSTQRIAVNLAAIRGDALRLARETKTQRRTWKGGTPDDFDRIRGISRVYEGRLYEAGICTYQALAQATVEQLASICRAPNHDHSHYQSWIDQARAFVQAQPQS